MGRWLFLVCFYMGFFSLFLLLAKNTLKFPKEKGNGVKKI